MLTSNQSFIKGLVLVFCIAGKERVDKMSPTSLLKIIYDSVIMKVNLKIVYPYLRLSYTPLSFICERLRFRVIQDICNMSQKIFFSHLHSFIKQHDMIISNLKVSGNSKMSTKTQSLRLSRWFSDQDSLPLLQGARVQFLVGDLRSNMSHSMVKKRIHTKPSFE